MNTMKKTTKNTGKRLCRLTISLILVMLMVMCMSTVVFATGQGTNNTNGAIAALTNFNNLLVTVVKLIGFAVALFGIVQAVTSFSSHDTSQRVNGFAMLAGGILIFFADQILAFIGVSI